MADHSDSVTRRHILQTGSFAVLSTIAGCSQLTRANRTTNEPFSTNNSTTTKSNTNGTPEQPPAVFYTKHGQYNFYDLPVFNKLPAIGENQATKRHPGNQIFDVKIKNKDYAVVTLENTKIYRPLKLTLNIRDKHGNYHHPSTTIQPQSEANRDRGVEHVASYDISNVPLPLGAGSYAEVTATDPTSSFPYTMALKRHRFVGIPYTDGVNWVNSDYLNITRYEKDGEDIIKQPSGVPGNKDSNPAGYIETIDKKNERVCFLAVINTVNEEVYGVSAHVKHDPYKKFMNKGRRYKAGHDFEYEGHYARDISHFQELAQKTSNALDGINITNRFTRLQALGDLIQTIPYYIHDSAPGGTIPLYELRGDCSEKTALFSDIVLNDPWNHVPAYINCTINGIPHQVIGIDTQDMGSPPENYRGLFTVAPTENQVNNGMPDTEYAFFDMTYNSQIGQKDRGASGPMSIYALGDFSNGNYTYEKDKPEY